MLKMLKSYIATFYLRIIVPLATQPQQIHVIMKLIKSKYGPNANRSWGHTITANNGLKVKTYPVGFGYFIGVIIFNTH